MANESSVHLAPFIMFVVTGSVDHLIAIPANCWALWLIVSGKRSLIESELLTLNLVTMETVCSLCFLLSLIRAFCNISSILPLLNFYGAVAVVGRALFQCQVCVDRYLAVIHPVVFIRYKQIRYRGACLAAVWLIVIWSGLANVFAPLNVTMSSICSFALLVPALFTELFCSLCILRILRRPRPGNKEAHEKEGNQQKKRAVRIICVALVMLVFNLVPFIAVPFLLRVTHVNLMPVAFALSTVGSSAQAFLFLSRSGELPCTGKG